MVEREILRDSGQYEAKLIAGFTPRNVACIILGSLVTIPVGLILSKTFVKELYVPVAAACGAPFFLCGWWKPYGVPLEKFFMTVFKTMILSPAKRKYQTELSFLDEPKKTISKAEQKKINKQRSIDLKKYEIVKY